METDCEHEWEPLEFEDGEKSKASVCSKCGALKSGQGSIVITADYIDMSPLTSNPALAEGRQWFRSDYDALYWSPDGSVIERIKTVVPAIASGSLTGIKGFEYLVEGAATDSWLFTMNPSTGVWIKQYSTDASFNAQMVYHGAYQHWTGDNTFVDVPNKAENVYGAGEEVTVHQPPDGTQISNFTMGGGASRGLTWDGEYLWFTMRDPVDTIYKLTKDGTVKDTFPSLGGDPTGIAWDGFYLWNADRLAPYIYQMTTGGSKVSGFSPGYDARGLTWDGEYLWSFAASGHAYKFTPDGTQKAHFTHSEGEGMTWDGEYLWIAGSTNNHIYQFTTDGTQKGVFPTPATSGRGLSWTGRYLWNADDNFPGIYQLGNAGSFDLDYRIAPA